MTKRRFACGNCGETFFSSTETNFLGAKNGEYWYTAQGCVAKCPACGSYAKEISQEEVGKCAQTVNILGTEYTITVKKYDEDEVFARRSIDGYCDSLTRQIVVCDMSTYKGWENEPQETMEAAQKETLRHEIVHAFFGESGLADSSNVVESAWAKNEEMVDWIAIQGPKIYKAWEEVNAL